ncbi:hypothetical protein RIF29_29472 [Crotalaria pallida]|uniref:Uncharacterized protein n=1 Tax=Crotalaria pallida TaxID=3830 RepID=A0AAN9EGS6_CROPI
MKEIRRRRGWHEVDGGNEKWWGSGAKDWLIQEAKMNMWWGSGGLTKKPPILWLADNSKTIAPPTSVVMDSFDPNLGGQGQHRRTAPHHE